MSFSSILDRIFNTAEDVVRAKEIPTTRCFLMVTSSYGADSKLWSAGVYEYRPQRYKVRQGGSHESYVLLLRGAI